MTTIEREAFALNQHAPKAPAQRWDPERYRRNASFVPALGQGVLDWLEARPGERILDLGCGDGALTAELAALCETVGVDQSAEQVAAAKAKGLDARVVDGVGLAFAGEFDAVFSNAALHWMRDADAVIDGVWRALRPGGRFVAEMGGAGNVATVIEALEAAVARRGGDSRAAKRERQGNAHGHRVLAHVFHSPSGGIRLLWSIAHVRGCDPGSPDPSSGGPRRASVARSYGERTPAVRVNARMARRRHERRRRAHELSGRAQERARCAGASVRFARPSRP
jgi:SAM-dependent methyltransferase